VERCLSNQLKMRQFSVFVGSEATATALGGLPGSIGGCKDEKVPNG